MGTIITKKTKRYTCCFLMFTFLALLSPSLVLAGTLDIYAPRTDDRVSAELEEGEKAELTIYLKSFGDPMDNHKVWIMDEFNRQVGSTRSDASGVITFSNLPAGRFRVFVERKKNPRGGATTVTVGDLRIAKLPPE